ncbi:hypothetical protein MMC11_002772 [Xylographa trunciseda]|nr:hypothetical protein [Xylographa trunciseda]
MEDFHIGSGLAHPHIAQGSETTGLEAITETPLSVDAASEVKAESQAEALSQPSNPVPDLKEDIQAEGPGAAPSGIRSLDSQAKHSDESESENDDSEDGDEDLEDRIKVVVSRFDNPYDVHLEALPNLAAYHPSFRKVEQMCLGLVNGAINMLKSSSYQDTQTEELIKYMSSHKEIEYPKATRIGMMGDSGVGKSSLINSLLGTSELANEGATGSACTCVVTEYCKAWPMQKQPFAAEIVFFEPTKRQAIIREHFRDYYVHYCESLDGLDRDAYEESEHRASTGFEAFRALFRNRAEFATDQAATLFLSSATSENDETILDQLFSWTQQLVLMEEAASGLASYFADTAEELGGKLKRFVQTVSFPQGFDQVASFWPIIRIVRVGLRSRLLQNGIVIADLPGLSDINKTRTGVTERYLRQCAYVLLVAPIARASTDKFVQRRLTDIFKSHCSRKAFICTYIDVMPPKTTPEELAQSEEDMQEYTRVKAALKKTLLRIEDLKISMRGLKGAAKQEAGKNLKTLTLRRKVLGTLRLEELIAMRNKKVTQSIRYKYSLVNADPKPLSVACVSNFDYTHHLEGYDEDSIPISLTATGIPGLRTSLLEIPAAAKLNVLRQYCHGILPGMISSLEMWSSKSITKRQQEFRAIVAKPLEAAEACISTFVEEIKSLMAKNVLGKIEESERSWIEIGVKTAGEWLSWNHATFKAWCRHDGNYSTKSKEQLSWNAELLCPVVEDLEGPWECFDRAIQQEVEKCLAKLLSLVDNIREDFRGVPGVEATNMTPFMESLTYKKVMLENCTNEISAVLEEISRDTRLDATTDESESFIIRALSPLYGRMAALSGITACINIRRWFNVGDVLGKQSSIARRALFKDAIGTGKPFIQLRSDIKGAVKRELDTSLPKMVQDVREVFKQILDDFDRMFVVVEVDNPSTNELRKQVQVFVTQARTCIDGPIVRELATAMGCLQSTSDTFT